MSQVLRSIDDTYANQAKSSTNYAKAPTLVLRTGGAGNSYGYMLVSGVPFGPGVIVSEFLLNLVNTAAWSGSVTITVQRVTSKWTASTVKYSKRPTVTTADQATLTISGAAANTTWPVNITAIAQAWASGAGNYGVQISVSGTTARAIHSAQASGKSSAFKPSATVTWSQPPPAPVSMNPDAGLQVSIARPTITWAYSDPAGTAMTGYQLQTNNSDSFTSPAYDSGIVDSSLPQHTLTTNILNGTQRFGRVRHRNAAGLWSPWSNTFTFGRTDKPTLTITNPGASPNNFVTETTPPITWTTTGTQVRFEVIYSSPVAGSATFGSGVQSGTDTAYTSSTPLPFPSGSQTVTVRSWDNVARATTPGDPAYVEASRAFTYTPGATTPITGLTVAIAYPKPVATLTWSRATAPDSFTIKRDGVVIAADLQAVDLTTGGTGYRFVDMTAGPGNHVWQVIAVVNGIDSAAAPTVTGDMSSIYIWLLDPSDPDWWLAIAGQESGTWAMGEQSDVFEVRGSDRLVVVSEALRGYEGNVAGSFHTDLPGLNALTAADLRDRVWALKRKPTNVWRLVLSDLNIPVVVRNVTVTPTPHKVLDFTVSFDYYQQGELPWSD